MRLVSCILTRQKSWGYVRCPLPSNTKGINDFWISPNTGCTCVCFPLLWKRYLELCVTSVLFVNRQHAAPAFPKLSVLRSVTIVDLGRASHSVGRKYLEDTRRTRGYSRRCDSHSLQGISVNKKQNQVSRWDATLAVSLFRGVLIFFKIEEQRDSRTYARLLLKQKMNAWGCCRFLCGVCPTHHP